LVRVTRDAEADYRQEPIAEVRFVPLVGEQGWGEEPARLRGARFPRRSTGLPALVREAAEPIDDIETTAVDALLERIADARLVLLGESTHGTSEFSACGRGSRRSW
jgi:protein-L-isoaspartate(D-aspartate) O-methyltransferase